MVIWEFLRKYKNSNIFEIFVLYTLILLICISLALAVFRAQVIFLASILLLSLFAFLYFKKLKETRQNLIEILNALPIAIATCDKDLNLKFINKKTLELLDCNSSDLCCATPNKIAQKLRLGTAGIVEFQTCKDKTVKLFIDKVEFKDGFLISMLDVKEEQAFDNLKIQASTILNSISNLVVLLDPCRKIITCNKSFCECVETPMEKLAGKDYDEFRQSLGYAEKACTSGEPTVLPDNRREVTFTTPSGVQKELLVHSSPIYDVYNKRIGIIGVGTDITEFNAQQQRIQQQDKLAIIGQMGSGIVHETKNHLASIKGYCQLINQKYGDSKLIEYVKRIETITNDVNRVISDFLALARPSAPSLNKISLNCIIESMRYMLDSPSFIRGIKLNINLSEKSLKIMGDEQQIKQVILNLAKNAIEAMLGVPNPVLQIETRLSAAGDRGIIIVSDNGKGICKEDMEALGKPFFTTKQTGTGLGLNVSYKIVKEHGGDIEVQSEDGVGTTFTVSFPICR